MARYMPQDIFNGCAIFTAMANYNEQLKKDVPTIFSRYQNSYKDDKKMFDDVEEASSLVLQAVGMHYPEEGSQMVMLRQIFSLNKYYELDGQKKKNNLLNGTFFNKERRYNGERAKVCAREIMVYIAGTQTGLFPVMKDD
jgi:hypothetical protein